MAEPPPQRVKQAKDEDGDTAAAAAPAVPAMQGSKKEQKLRAWTTDADANPSTVYTVRVTAGDPSRPLPSWVKTCKKGELQDMVRQRGLPTDGSKEVRSKCRAQLLVLLHCCCWLASIRCGRCSRCWWG